MTIETHAFVPATRGPGWLCAACGRPADAAIHAAAVGAIIHRVLLALLLCLAWPAHALASYECFTKPNAAAAAFPAQARLFEQDFQTLSLGLRGTGVVFAAGACQVAAQGSPNMTVNVTNGCTIAVVGTTASVTSGNVTITAANATNPRFDLVGATSAGTKSAIAGTPAASPLPPTIPDNYVPFAFVYVPATDTAINANQITDSRPCIPTPGVGTGAATTLSYITKVAEGTLSNEFALGSLATGLLVNTITTGVPTVLVPTDDNIAVGNGSTWQLKALPTCSGGSSALTYNISTNAFGCNTISGGGSTPTGTGFTHITAGAQDGGAKLVDTADINASQVTYAKMQNVSAASRLLGRGSAGGAGAPEEITLGAGLTMTGTSLSSSGGGGSGTVTHTVGALTADRLVIGNGTDDVEVLGSLGTTTTLLHGNAAGAPTFGPVVSADLNLTATTCTNQFVSAISSAAAGTCTTDTLASAQHANQGTTTTLLHGNAAGNPSWTGVAIADLTATGTPSSSTFLRGDNQWATPAGGGSVTTTGSPASGQVALVSGASSITGDAGLLFDPSIDKMTLRQATSTGANTTASPTLNVTSLTGPTAAFEFSDTGTSNVGLVTSFKHTTSGAMVDGFGVGMEFLVRDNSAADNGLASIYVDRSGADNTGRMRLLTTIAGTQVDRLLIDQTGAVTLSNLASGGTQCVQASSAGLLSGTGASCGGGGGATLTTFATARPADANSTLPISSQTTRSVSLFELPGSITVNQLSIYFTSVPTPGSLRMCLYSADGATKLVDISITPAAGVVSGAVASVPLTPGRYYAVVGCGASACSVVAAAAPAPSASTLFGNNSPAGKPKWIGTVTHTSGTCNTTLGTITGTNTAQAVLRGDQ